MTRGARQADLESSHSLPAPADPLEFFLSLLYQPTKTQPAASPVFNEAHFFRSQRSSAPALSMPTRAVTESPVDSLPDFFNAPIKPVTTSSAGSSRDGTSARLMTWVCGVVCALLIVYGLWIYSLVHETTVAADEQISFRASTEMASV